MIVFEMMKVYTGGWRIYHFDCGTYTVMTNYVPTRAFIKGKSDFFRHILDDAAPSNHEVGNMNKFRIFAWIKCD